ncbi:class I SAM-dependent methyltransferase [endosymbiont of Ridgeia piscesae]|jgi:SAM-dependent methyltransferase|uniref:Tellurite resistance protein TehB n=1 Tax=endosymbiont of Ridgeia piscesae TaxID=54398 RepID=A0A0T5YW07_9GAMM|nr:class I SAM-dependent methyltransferase [endosymbiont of Ridgeia piscesae]KRT54732.1 Tellurite resistance protein TehB [endosymbiont of Ridgeia piscesae]KRT58585.1 Tellurite resistance protein TehB [endosymbiont of Ridgeia piscesae]
MEERLEKLRAKWDERHAAPEKPVHAAEVLSENLHLLPATGDALELACGLGGNALALARAGLRVTAWDLSPVAIKQLNTAADAEGLSLSAQVRDIESEALAPASYDVIVASYFLDRSLIPGWIEALRPGGLIFFQTFSQTRLTSRGPNDPAFRLADNELLSLFSSLRLRFYREEGELGDVTKGSRDLAMLVGQKP